MKRENALMHDLLFACRKQGHTEYKLIEKKKRNQAFNEYERIVISFIEEGVSSADTEMLDACQEQIDRAYRELTDFSSISLQLKQKTENKGEEVLSSEEIAELIKEKMENIIFLSKIKELQHLYEIKRWRLDEESRYCRLLRDVDGLSDALDIVEKNPNSSVRAITDKGSGRKLNIQRIFHCAGECFYFTQSSDNNVKVQLSADGMKIQVLRQKRSAKNYSRLDMEDAIYKSCDYLMQQIIDGDGQKSKLKMAPLDISPEKQRLLQKKFERIRGGHLVMAALYKNNRNDREDYVFDSTARFAGVPDEEIRADSNQRGIFKVRNSIQVGEAI